MSISLFVATNLLSVLVLGTLWKKHSYLRDLLNFYHPLVYKNKLWIMWKKEDYVFVSPSFQRLFNTNEYGKLIDTLSFLDQQHYNHLVHHINRIEQKKFEYIFEHLKGNYYHVTGYTYKNVKILEFRNVSKERDEATRIMDENTRLQEENKIFYSIFNEIPVPISCVQREVVACNQAYARLFAKTIDQILKSQEHPEPHFKITRNGQTRYYVMQKIPLFDDLSMEYISDQTDFHNMQQNYQEYKKYFSNIMQRLSIPIIVINEYFKLEFYNQSYVQLFGCDPAFLDQKPSILEILDDLYMRQKIPEPDNFVKFKNQYIDDLRYLTETREEILHLGNGQILRHVMIPSPSKGIIFMYEDVTNHFQLVQKNKILSDVQKETIDNLYEGILVLGSDHKIRLSNDTVDRLFKMKAQSFEHISQFLEQISPYIPNQKMLELFEKRQNFEDRFNLDGEIIKWAYTPLPDGSHMLQFIQV